MKLHFRRTKTWKTLAYGLYFLLLFLCSHAFLPALLPALPLPNMTIPALCLLAMTEDGGYAAVFAVVFGALDAAVLDFATAPLVLFYLLVTLLSAKLFSSLFSRGFLPWLGYTIGWLVLFALLMLFSMVSAWQERVGMAFFTEILAQSVSSLCFAVLTYPLLWRLTRRFSADG